MRTRRAVTDMAAVCARKCAFRDLNVAEVAMGVRMAARMAARMASAQAARKGAARDV